MKKIMLLFTTIVTGFTTTFAQTKSASKENLRTEIIALERAGWEAWKNKDTAWFRFNTTNDCVWISSDGIIDKQQMIAGLKDGCNVASVSVDSFSFMMLNDRAVLLTYIAIQDAVCDNKKSAPKIRASVNYVKQAGKWREAFYMETPVP